MSRQAPSTPAISTLLPVQLNADVPSKRTAIEGMVESPWRQGEEALMTPWYKPASQVCVPEARLEGECVLTAFARKVRSIEIAGPTRRRYNNTLRALASLPVVLRPA